MSEQEERDAQIRREAIADERAKVVRHLGTLGGVMAIDAASRIQRGEHLERDRRASAPTSAPEAACAKLRVNGAHARCGA
jgi:hypothetical protein